MKRVYLLALILLVLTACRKEANAVPSSISFTPASVTVSEGRTFSLNIRAKYGDSFKTYDLRANTASLRFTSSRENVATVSASGEVTAKSSGQTIIEAASPDGKLQAKCTVNVSAEAVDYTKPFSTECIDASMILPFFFSMMASQGNGGRVISVDFSTFVLLCILLFPLFIPFCFSELFFCTP